MERPRLPSTLAGAPEEIRRDVWMKLCRRLPDLPKEMQASYVDLLAEPCIYLHAVKIDVGA
jgi:hypothetical protein